MRKDDYDLGKQFRNISRDRKKLIVDLYYEGWDYFQIASATHVGVVDCYSIIKKYHEKRGEETPITKVWKNIIGSFLD